MNRTRIKICGVCSATDAAEAVRAGADAIGVIFAESPRRLTPSDAAGVLADVPPLVSRVGVFVNASAEQIAEAIATARLSAIQLAGDETPEFCASMPVPVVKVLRVGQGFSWDDAEPYQGTIAAALLDTGVAGSRGGSGVAFDWPSVPAPPRWLPVIVAGGLNPGNVAAAVTVLRPFAVDVSSGVEAAPRVKDPVKVSAFVAAVRAADERIRR